MRWILPQEFIKAQRVLLNDLAVGLMSNNNFSKKMGSPHQLAHANAVATALLDWISQTLYLIGSLMWLVFCASYNLLLWHNAQMNFDPWKVNSDRLLDDNDNEAIRGQKVKDCCAENWNSGQNNQKVRAICTSCFNPSSTKGGGYYPLKEFFQPAEMLNSAIKWQLMIVGSSFEVIPTTTTKLLPYLWWE